MKKMNILRFNFYKKNLQNFTSRVKFTSEFKTKINFVFTDPKDFEKENDSVSDFKKNFPLNFNEIKNGEKTIIDRSMYYKSDTEQSDNKFNHKILIIKNNANRDILAKSIKEAMNLIMSLNNKSLLLTFSKSIDNIRDRSYIINQIICSNYIARDVVDGKELDIDFNFRVPYKREKLNLSNQQSIIQEIRIYYDNFFENNYNKKKVFESIISGLSKNYSRKLSNLRANVANCDFMEKEAINILNKENLILDEIIQFNPNSREKYNSLSLNYEKNNKNKCSVEVVKGKQLLDEKMNLFYNVGKSAETEPRLIILKYNGDETSNEYSHCILGKGLTFDTGGINLKPTGYLEDMFLDKHGACSTLSVFKAIKNLGLKINIICALAVAENSIDSNSYKPSDIIEGRNGIRVEVGNTDAEGRLCLADSLTYLQDKYSPNVIIDIATLTGACMVALVRNYFY